MLNKEEVKEILKQYKFRYNKILESKYLEFYNYIINNVEGDTFPEKLYKWLHDDKINIGKCLYCLEPTRFYDVFSGYSNYCSAKCGNSNPITKQRKEESSLLRFGVTNVSKSEETKKTKRETFRAHYGVDCNFQDEGVKKQIKETNLRKYGTEHPLQSNTVKSYIFRKNYKRFFTDERYNSLVIPLFTEEEYKGVELTYNWQCKLCNNEFESHLQDGRIPRCYRCFPQHTSNAQREILKYIKSLFNHPDPFKLIIQNDRKILNGLELDMYIPSLKLAIEFDGLFYHSEIEGEINKEYHLNKTTLCENQGITLLHIFENEWMNIDSKEIIKNLLKNIIANNVINIENSIGIIKLNDSEVLLDRRFYNINSKFNKNLEIVEILPPKQNFLNDFHSDIINEASNDWIWDCGYLKMKIL